jgi:hypothetical protein
MACRRTPSVGTLAPTCRLPAAILMASKPEEIDLDALTEREGSNLLANLVHQRARLGQYAEKALVDGQTAVACERVIGQNLETCGKLLQRFIVRHEHSSHLLMHPEYIRLRSTLVQTLRQFPDAAAAVARALHALDQDAVQAITEAKRAKHPPVAIEHQQQEASS